MLVLGSAVSAAWAQDRGDVRIATAIGREVERYPQLSIFDHVTGTVEGGVVTNRFKQVHRGRTVTSFVMGTRRLYDFVDDNPLVEFHGCDRTNDTAIIAANPRVTAVNSAIEIDLSGQVCADSIGHRIYSGIGGQMDFIRGAARSRGGKPVIALPSTAKGGTRSRIVLIRLKK